MSNRMTVKKGSPSAFHQGGLLLLLLGMLLWSGYGCGGPRHRPEEFIGKWQIEQSKNNEIALELNGDGFGHSRLIFYPTGASVQWVLVGDELKVTPTDGTITASYRYRFNGPEKLVLTVDGKETTLVKVK